MERHFTQDEKYARVDEVINQVLFISLFLSRFNCSSSSSSSRFCCTGKTSECVAMHTLTAVILFGSEFHRFAILLKKKCSLDGSLEISL